MWALSTCGEPDEIKKNTHPKNIALFFYDQDNNPEYNGFNGKTVRVGYDVWDKFDADEFVGKFAPPVVRASRSIHTR